MLIVAWNSAWIYAQQVYLLHDVNKLEAKDLEEKWWRCMIKFAETYGQSDWIERLCRELVEIEQR